MAANDAPPLTPWLCDAVKAACQPNQSARKGGVLVQALDVAKQPNHLSGGINCVLSDREHSVGAVLTPSAMLRWRQAMPTYEHAQLNCAILVLDSFDVAVNETTGQFTLRVHEFTWLAAAAETFGQPCCIMSDPTVHALFHRIAPACAPAPPPAPRPRGGGESYLLRLQRRSYPMARACFPVEARPPHAVLLEYAAIPRAEQSQLDLLVRASQPHCRAPAEEPSQGEELEIEAAEPCATATASSGAAPACVRERKESTSEAVACGFLWEPQLDVEEGIEPPGGTQILDQVSAAGTPS
ncbi:hypothetical protein AB1Y20_002762 [Prymnesium parvum]|uniref:Uncharacterized protein n=1 Tax=Prymnesium parvum TaxID=97485 RepID=A0AB34JA99_PRYPA